VEIDLKNEILKDPDYFYCEKLHCRLKIDVCLQRQRANLKRRRFEPIPFMNCQNCSQGVENLRFKKNGGNMPQERPLEGDGKKNINCEKYTKCLDIAVKKDWEAFNCEKCPFYNDQKQTSQIKDKTENTRVCKKCGEKPTMQPSSPYCSKCLHDMKRAKQSADTTPKKKIEGTDKQETVNDPKAVDTVAKIDFGKYISVLKEVEKLADKEMRPLGFQVAYILQKHLENVGSQ